MAATVEICESNDSAGESITHNITNSNYGNSDTANLTPATYPVIRTDNSFQKWQRLHVTGGTFNSVDNIRVYRSAGSLNSGVTHICNFHTVQGTYDTMKKTAWEVPDKTTGDCPETFPSTKPGSANLGIGGSLTGSLTAAGYTDYGVHMVTTDGTTPTGDQPQLTITWVYDEQ